MPRRDYYQRHKEELQAKQRAYRRTEAGLNGRRAERKTPAHRAAHKRTKARLTGRRMTKHSFLAIDGEGATVNGHHFYTMIATSDPEYSLMTGEPLSSFDCLNFIADLPVRRGQYIVAFFFDYDVTMILRDMAQSDPALAYKLFDHTSRSYVWWKGFGLKYTPHKSLTVKRYTKDNSAPAVVIHDAQGFFQSSFVKALEKFDIGSPEERQQIADMKEQRDSFTWAQSSEVMVYSQHECALLVTLMERVRDLAELAGVNPEPYEGPGSMARRSLEKHYGKNAHQETMDLMSGNLMLMWFLFGSMYGGRFEIPCMGPIPGEIKEYDLKSAYPAAMSKLECLRHGKWIRSKGHPGLLRISLISFHHTEAEEWGSFYALPVRKRTGELHYPRDGRGWYWEEEYDVPGLEVEVEQSYVFKPSGCDCRPFDWVLDMFNQRLAMEDQHEGSGICLKLVLNTLYGKMAQQKPVPGTFLNIAYASLITMRTRKRIYALAKSLPPKSVVMFATDAIFVRSPAELEESKGLGGLELAHTYHSMTIVQPGMYFDGETAHFKTRGVSKKYIQKNMAAIRAAVNKNEEYKFQVTHFRGMRWCLANGRLQDVGQWIERPRTMKSDGQSKRIGRKIIDGIAWTKPAPNVNVDLTTQRRDIVTEDGQNHFDLPADIEREWHDFVNEAPDAEDE